MAHGLAVVLGKVGMPGHSVQIGCPLKFICSRTEAGFIEESPADVVTNVGLISGRPHCSQCPFVEDCCIVPAVLPLIDLGKYQQ